ncbi:uncharacterized protein LOC142320875 [Lycorma delicatula]|uniref:uncharacterized protein LOC142320875 n=1 Tax=Lycorma delicatula TaxID=130591 RepID=UPI003F5172DB
MQSPAVSSYKFLLISVFLAMLLCLVSAQGYDYFGGYFSRGVVRDQRGNRAGPVTFPSNPPGSETSGVRVGASGYGFVPPSGSGGSAITGALPGNGPQYSQGVNYW